MPGPVEPSSILGQVRAAARLLDVINPRWIADFTAYTEPDLQALRNGLIAGVFVLTDPKLHEAEVRWEAEIDRRLRDQQVGIVA